MAAFTTKTHLKNFPHFSWNRMIIIFPSIKKINKSLNGTENDLNAIFIYTNENWERRGRTHKIHEVIVERWMLLLEKFRILNPFLSSSFLCWLISLTSTHFQREEFSTVWQSFLDDEHFHKSQTHSRLVFYSQNFNFRFTVNCDTWSKIHNGWIWRRSKAKQNSSQINIKFLYKL